MKKYFHFYKNLFVNAFKTTPWLLLIVCAILFSNIDVYASDFNMNSLTSGSLNGTKNRYRATEIYNSGTSNTYTFGTQYSGRISDIETYFDYPFEANTTYTLTYNMNTDDFRNNFGTSYWWDCSSTMDNNNAHAVSVSYISYKKVKVSFRPNDNTTCIRMWLKSTNTSSVAITGVSNWRLNSITIYDPDYQGSGGSGGSGGTPTPTPDSNQQIIDNANQNTSDIIENNNQNTKDIIDNQNQNQEQTNNLLGSCNKNYFDLSSSYLSSSATYTINNSTGTLNVSNSSWKNVRFAIPVSSGTYNFSFDNSLPSNVNVVLYFNTTADYSNSTWLANMTTTNKNFTLNSGYLIVNIYDNSNSAISYSISGLKLTNTYTSTYILPNQSVCTSKLDETNNYLQDDSDPNISDSEFTNLFNSVGFNDPLSYLLQLPVQFINQLVSQSNTCQIISLGTLWGVSLSLPCINIGSIIGQQVWDIIDVLFSVGLLVVIFKNLYQTFANLMTMGGEKEAREKFSMPTPMEFLSLILGGDR